MNAAENRVAARVVVSGREHAFRRADAPAPGPAVRPAGGRFTSLAAAACAELRRAVDYCAPLPLYDQENAASPQTRQGQEP